MSASCTSSTRLSESARLRISKANYLSGATSRSPGNEILAWTDGTSCYLSPMFENEKQDTDAATLKLDDGGLTRPTSFDWKRVSENVEMLAILGQNEIHVWRVLRGASLRAELVRKVSGDRIRRPFRVEWFPSARTTTLGIGDQCSVHLVDVSEHELRWWNSIDSPVRGKLEAFSFVSGRGGIAHVILAGGGEIRVAWNVTVRRQSPSRTHVDADETSASTSTSFLADGPSSSRQDQVQRVSSTRLGGSVRAMTLVETKRRDREAIIAIAVEANSVMLSLSSDTIAPHAMTASVSPPSVFSTTVLNNDTSEIDLRGKIKVVSSTSAVDSNVASLFNIFGRTRTSSNVCPISSSEGPTSSENAKTTDDGRASILIFELVSSSPSTGCRADVGKRRMRLVSVAKLPWWLGTPDLISVVGVTAKGDIDVVVGSHASCKMQCIRFSSRVEQLRENLILPPNSGPTGPFFRSLGTTRSVELTLRRYDASRLFLRTDVPAIEDEKSANAQTKEQQTRDKVPKDNHHSTSMLAAMERMERIVVSEIRAHRSEVAGRLTAIEKRCGALEDSVRLLLQKK